MTGPGETGIFKRIFMWILHPNGRSMINSEKFELIKPCSINTTHLDFYRQAPAEGERGEPSYTIVCEDAQKREDYFRDLLRSFTYC